MRLLTSPGQQPNLEASQESDLEVGCWLTLPAWDHEMELKHRDGLNFIFVKDCLEKIGFLNGYLKGPKATKCSLSDSKSTLLLFAFR